MEARAKIETAIAPFKVQQLVEVIMDKKALSFTDALHYLYSSELYARLFLEETKWWYSGGDALYDLIEQEKAAAQPLQGDRKLTLFFIFCIEAYAEYKGQPSEAILTLFSTAKVFDFLKESFEVLHTQSKEIITDTIDDFIQHAAKP
jgi:hypothetical protein